MSYYIYKFFNNQDDLLYVGQTINPSQRFSAHFSENNWKSKEVSYIEYAKCETKTDMQIYEIYYINKLKPKYNKALTYNQIPSFQLEELDFKRYIKDISKPHKSKFKKTTQHIRHKEIDNTSLHQKYLFVLSKYIHKITEINYNKYLNLYIKIKDIEENDYKLLNIGSLPLYLSSLHYSYQTKDFQITFKKEQNYSHLDSYILKQFKEIYNLLDIDNLHLDKQYGINKEKARIEALCNYFQILLKEKDSMTIKNIITKEIKIISINKLIKNLTKVINTGEGYYTLQYGNLENRLIFYDDFRSYIKTYNPNSYAFENINDLNIWLKKEFKDELYKFKTKKDYNLFWYFICKKKIPFSYSSDAEGSYVQFDKIVEEDITVEMLKKYD